jgi:hypothetical protein
MKTGKQIFSANKHTLGSIHGLMIAFLLSPIGTPLRASADPYDSACKKVVEQGKELVKHECKSNADKAECQTANAKLKEMNASENTVAECMKANLAKRTEDWEMGKSYVYLAASTSCGILSAMVWAGADTACSIIGWGALGAGLAVDQTGKNIVHHASKDYRDQISSSIEKTDWIDWNTAWQSGISGSGAVLATTLAGKSVTVIGNKMKLGCLGCAIGNGVSSYLSNRTAGKAGEAKTTFSTNVMTMTEDLGDSNTGFNSSFQTTKATGKVPQASNSKAGLDLDGCEKEKGDAVLTCMGRKDPEIAAITNNPAAMKEIKKALRGKSIGDLIKEHDRKTDPQQQIAKAAGISAAGAEKISQALQKLDQKYGISKNILSNGSGYAKSGSVSPGKSDYEFGGKSGSGVASNLKDASLGSEQPVAAVDPMESLFRQLDLLSADQIYENKNISLFVRAAHRYRKNLDKVEKLNSALEDRVPSSSKK